MICSADAIPPASGSPVTEQQDAEFEEATSNYVATFQLLDQPTTFPTP